MAELRIYKCIDGEQTDELRCRVEKWQVTDSFMGENFLTFSLESPVPVDFTIGDWCEFRGETYYLNYLPSCTQEGHAGDGGKAFQYQNVKMNTAADELTRCEFLDVVLTSGAHVASEGTNYTGSSTFSLYCHSVEVVYEQETIFFCPAHVLLDKILANLVRLYGTTDGEPYDGTNSKWKIFIDDSKCLTKTCVISASNWTVAQALSEVHNSFVMDDGSGKHLDYIIRGRNIIVGDVSDLVEDYPELGPITGYLTDINGDGHIYNYGYENL